MPVTPCRLPPSLGAPPLPVVSPPRLPPRPALPRRRRSHPPVLDAEAPGARRPLVPPEEVPRRRPEAPPRQGPLVGRPGVRAEVLREQGHGEVGQRRDEEGVRGGVDVEEVVAVLLVREEGAELDGATRARERSADIPRATWKTGSPAADWHSWLRTRQQQKQSLQLQQQCQTLHPHQQQQQQQQQSRKNNIQLASEVLRENEMF